MCSKHNYLCSEHNYLCLNTSLGGLAFPLCLEPSRGGWAPPKHSWPIQPEPKHSVKHNYTQPKHTKHKPEHNEHKPKDKLNTSGAPEPQILNTTQTVFKHTVFRGACGDYLVGVDSRKKSGARARVLFFIFYFLLPFKVSFGHFRHTSLKKKRKKWHAPIRVRAEPPTFFFVFLHPAGATYGTIAITITIAVL